jgi:hypothetical protein
LGDTTLVATVGAIAKALIEDGSSKVLRLLPLPDVADGGLQNISSSLAHPQWATQVTVAFVVNINFLERSIAKHQKLSHNL